jgi:low affinity Fe/Cu permease
MSSQNHTGREQSTWRECFRKFAHGTAQFAGSPWIFVLACLVIIGWAALGPTFDYSDTWQLVINTGTTIVTFLMVFLIQNTQNRDTRAIHLKLDELIRALRGARNKLVNLEEMSDEELDVLQEEFHRVCGARGRAPRPPPAGVQNKHKVANAA